MESIKELLDRKIQLALNNVKEAKFVRQRMIDEATSNGDKLVSYHEGQLQALDQLHDLDWKLYAKNELGAK